MSGRSGGKGPSKKAIRSLLSSLNFDPKQPPFNVWIDIDSDFYYMNRAIELIKENQRELGLREENLKIAIQLLILTLLRNQ